MKLFTMFTLREKSPKISVFSPNTGKYGPEKLWDTFHAVLLSLTSLYIFGDGLRYKVVLQLYHTTLLCLNQILDGDQYLFLIIIKM